MKRGSLFLALWMCSWIAACGSGDTENTDVCPECVMTPEAVAADDGMPTGVYKGVLFGGGVSGNVKATIATDQSTGTCQIKTGGQTYNSSDFTASITRAVGMTYTFSNSNFTLILVLDDAGKVASVTLTLSGNDIGASVAKEQSTVLVECFEGTWTQTVGGGDHGIWNVAIHGSRFVGGATGPDGSWSVITGTMDGLQFIVDNPEGQTGTGSLSKDRKTVSGTWEWPGASGTTEGQRTL